MNLFEYNPAVTKFEYGPTAAVFDTGRQYCTYCSNPPSYIYHSGCCPLVKAIEYYPNGSIKRIEFVGINTFQTPRIKTNATWPIVLDPDAIDAFDVIPTSSVTNGDSIQ